MGSHASMLLRKESFGQSSRAARLRKRTTYASVRPQTMQCSMRSSSAMAFTPVSCRNKGWQTSHQYRGAHALVTIPETVQDVKARCNVYEAEPQPQPSTC